MGNTLENLKAAAAGEHEEWSDLYPAFAQVAKEEGFPEVATAFTMIAKAEVNHETRFNKLADNVRDGKVFKKDEPTEWICRKCDTYTKEKASRFAPTCLHKQPHFNCLKKHINIILSLSD